MFVGKKYTFDNVEYEIDVCELDEKYGYINLEIDYKDNRYDYVVGEYMIKILLKNVNNSFITKKTMDFSAGEYYIDNFTYGELKFICMLLNDIHYYFVSIYGYPKEVK